MLKERYAEPIRAFTVSAVLAAFMGAAAMAGDAPPTGQPESGKKLPAAATPRNGHPWRHNQMVAEARKRSIELLFVGDSITDLAARPSSSWTSVPSSSCPTGRSTGN